jgi:hypothetical protein
MKTCSPFASKSRSMPAWLLAALCALGLAGCSALPSTKPHVSVWQNERFQADEMFSRQFDAPPTDTCEAARRALLSQGYVINQAESATVKGSKRFQPEAEVHVELSFTVVCLPDSKNGQAATAYASVQQERYIVKKSSISTSVGVSALGSISIPTSSSQDSLVKVAAETVSSTDFYDRFFALMGQNLRELVLTDVAPSVSENRAP